MGMHSRYGQEAMEREAVRKHARRITFNVLVVYLMAIPFVFGMVGGIGGFVYSFAFVLCTFPIVGAVVRLSIMRKWKRERAGL